MSASEYHVASFIVRTRPCHEQQVAAAINVVPGLEVHGIQDGKLVVTAEGEHVRDIARLTQDLQTADHVLGVAPIYHEFTHDEASSTGAGLE